MEIKGVALATMISQVIGFGAGVYLIIRIKVGLGANWDVTTILSRQPLLALMVMNRDIFIRSLCVIAAVAMFTIQGAKMGELVLAANGILILFQAFLSYGLDGFAHAAESLVGAAVGARDRTALRNAVKISTQLALLVSVGYVAIFILFGDAIIAGITDLPDVRASVRQYFGWVIISPLVSVWAFQLDGIFIGATRAGDMRNAMLISFCIYLVLMFNLLAYLGNHGLWLAFTVFMIARAVTLMAFYPRLERTTTDSIG
jgi:MATE family multidrug resistance protein